MFWAGGQGFMFERYTEDAKRAIFFAYHEAKRQTSAFIETQHLLIGLIREPRNQVNRLFGLASHSDNFRERLLVPKTKLHLFSKVGDIPLSLPNKRALAYAAQESDLLGSKVVDTGHLLLGLLRENESNVPAVLATAGISLDLARIRVREYQSLSSFGKLQANLKTLKPLQAVVLLVTVIAVIFVIVRLAVGK
jgi:ATP-dependent Clp protease ATP-binding subunit ClpC